MTCTSQQAERECLDLFTPLTFVNADKRYEGNEQNEPPSNKAFLNWTMQHTDGLQGSLADYNGKRRWRREGLIIVQCFALLSDGSKSQAQRMAESVRDAYQGKATPGGVWFRNATANAVGRDGLHYQANAIIQFTYDEVR